MFTNRAARRTAGALAIALAFALLFFAFVMAAIFLPHKAFAQESHAEFWQAENARQASAASKPARRTPPPNRHYTPPPRGYASGGPLLAVASRYVGARNPTGTRGPWCRDFVNHVVRKAGLPLADTSRKARDAVRLGRRVSQPRPGDLAVMRSHVTIVAGFEDGRVVGLGGNQCGGRVCVSRYAQARVIAFIRIGS
jgi:uncharacterized protein (TIGR02594 family)